MTQARRAESSGCHLVIVSYRGYQALTLGRGKENRGRAREREREREREGECKCHPNGFPRVGVPGLVHRL
jgi:hypothetical protein